MHGRNIPGFSRKKPTIVTSQVLYPQEESSHFEQSHEKIHQSPLHPVNSSIKLVKLVNYLRHCPVNALRLSDSRPRSSAQGIDVGGRGALGKIPIWAELNIVCLEKEDTIEESYVFFMVTRLCVSIVASPDTIAVCFQYTDPIS
ncbi:predicted protein [Sclerotinia sclerotiorum 1980 UF-70]|uniref:Uncharacterized protein n=1 Tax=Sclerotinia sclerotiorum (strain ATCC 18683 / 1980 / Ss-1) TaxID=665079 RepID=A7ED17_SCLS1|nr:predicted protein [Sclerotinia sclerotiorum 1980 UF-70]EDO00733.1 predicted protein [Sclerotinia sclerotiorum 1980 UF-70]